MSKVKLEINRKSPSEKIDLAKKIVTKMTGNAIFTTPNPALAAITTAATNLGNAIADADNARKTVEAKMSILAQQELLLDAALTQIGAYVENVSNGDEIKILSAGMDVKRESSSTVMPDKIASLTATLGDSSGEIDLTWDRVAAAKSYILETAINGGSQLDWKHALVSTKSKAELTSLQTGTTYQIRVAAVGSAGQGPWSDPVVKVAP